MAKRSFDRTTPSGRAYIDIVSGEVVRQDPKQILADRIRHHRLQRGFEQKELAERIGITGNAISNWETGRARPDVSLLPVICDALDITLYELFGLEGPNARLSADETKLIERYRELSSGNKHTVSVLADTLQQVQAAECCRTIIRLINCDHALAAGIGDPSEFEDEGKPAYVYDSVTARRADYVFHVNGDSMEPDFPNGSAVLVERIPGAMDLAYGEVGAFMIGNEAYIKVYQEDGLHSLNPIYRTMRFSGEDRVFLIGRVLGILEDSEIAVPEDVDGYLLLHPESIC